MDFLTVLEKRRSYYNIGSELPVNQEVVLERIYKVTELIPDAFNMKSQRLVVLMGEKHVAFWQMVAETYQGKVQPEKIAAFQKGAGTILFYIDHSASAPYKENYPAYADRFDGWNAQANGMLQLAIWTALRDLGLGASLQHYNPLIDAQAKDFCNLEGDVTLLAQMVFGSILSEPDPKEAEESKNRVSIML